MLHSAVLHRLFRSSAFALAASLSRPNLDVIDATAFSRSWAALAFTALRARALASFLMLVACYHDQRRRSKYKDNAPAT